MNEDVPLPSSLLLRFRDGNVNMYPCVNPETDVHDKQRDGDIDFFRFEYPVLVANRESIGKYFNFHSSTIDNLTNLVRRSEFHCREEYILITLRYPHFDAVANAFEIFSVSLILTSDRIMLLAPEKESAVFDPVIRDLLESSGNVYKYSIARLATRLTDAIFGIYTTSLEEFGDVLNKLESEIIDSNPKTVFAMTALVRKQNIFLQQTILPLKEMSFNMRHAESDMVTPDIDNYLHVLSDQIQRIIDSAGMLSQINSGLLDIYANAQATRMNEIMRTLTVFSVLTLPVTVLSGFYGMNFIYLPGLSSLWGVIIIVLLMGLFVGLIVWFCRRKNII